jgi:hypothetical protein
MNSRIPLSNSWDKLKIQDDRSEERMRTSRDTARTLLAWLLVLGLVGCSSFTTYTTKSLPAEQEIKIDGKTDDWLGALSIIEDGSVSVGFRNDRESLYVCLMVEEEFLLAQIMRQGLTLWLDPRGGTAKALGIRYPLGMPRGERPEEQGEEPGPPPSEGYPEEAKLELEIIRSEKEAPQRMEIEEARGIEVIAVPRRGLLVYEIKIPLIQTESQLIAVGAQPGQTVGIGFETPKPDRSQRPEPRSGGIPGGGGGRPGGGGMPPTGGGRGAGPGGGPGRGMMGEMPNGFKIWALVHLSSENMDRVARRCVSTFL